MPIGALDSCLLGQTAFVPQSRDYGESKASVGLGSVISANLSQLGKHLRGHGSEVRR